MAAVASQWWAALREDESARRRAAVAVALGFVVVLALSLRLTGVNWDNDHHLNPDERFLSTVSPTIQFPSGLGEYFDTDKSPLNPYNKGFPTYVYGTLPLFTTKAVGEFLGLGGYNDVTLVGRVLSALVDVGSVIVLFLLGSYLFNRRVGLLAAFLLSVTVLHIQYSHYFVVDNYLAFFSLVSIYFAVRAAKEGGWRNFAVAGVTFGLALASKGSAAPLALIITMAAAIRAWPSVRDRLANMERPIAPATASFWQAIWSDELRNTLLGLALAAGLTFVTFRVAQPYAFDGPWPWSISQTWLNDIDRVLDIQSGKGAFPPSVRWIGSTPYLYPLQNIALWGLGLPLALAAGGGFLYAAWRLVRHRELTLLLLLTWVAVIFVWQGGRFTSYMRYVLHIYPVLVLLAAYGLVELWQAAGIATLPERIQRFLPAPARHLPLLGRVAVAAVVVLTLLYALAFTNIYRHPVTRVEASGWIFDNVPRGSAIGVESAWDDGLPFPVDGHDPGTTYRFIDLQLYDFDTVEKRDALVAKLDDADYLTISSDRLYRSIPRAPAVYPMTSLYYELLFSGQLGFDRIKTFTSFPRLFGISISDDGAEESFTVYDHPKALIFKKSATFSREKVAQLLGAAPVETAMLLLPADAGRNGLLLRPDDLKTQRSGGTWTDIFDSSSFPNEHSKYAWLVWLLPIQLAALALVPAAVRLFRRLPDRGYLLTKPLGLLVVSYLVFTGVSLGLVEFTRDTIEAAMLLVIALGLVSYVAWREQVLGFVRERWRSILLAEVIFIGAFLALYLLRLENPDLWHPFRGGEKPMNFAYLNAITRSTTLPPYDPWFAGGYLNYYYFGHFMTATMVKLTGILPEISYNLAVPLFFAFTVGVTYSLGYNLAGAVRSRLGGYRTSARTAVSAGLLAIVMVAVAGNLDAIDQMVDRLSLISPWHLGSGIPVISGTVGALGGLWKVIIGGAGLPTIDYWRPSRMMAPTISITEFPFFSFLFADLHAHVMAIPYAITSLGVGLALVQTGAAERRPGSWLPSLNGLLLAVTLALILGALRWINSWDYPTFLLVGIAALLICERASEGRLSWPLVVRGAVGAGLIVFLSVLLFYPFQADYEQFQAGLHRTVETTVLRQYLSHFGLFIVVIAGLLTFLWARTLRRTNWDDAIRQFIAVTFGLVFLTVLLLALSKPLERFIPISVTDLSAGQFLKDLVDVRIPTGSLPSFGVPLLPFAYPALAAVIVLAWHELRRDLPDSPLRLFILAMLAMALGLSIGVDVVNIDGDIQRMNTVFKFYVHIWLLLALVSAFGAWYLLLALRPPPASAQPAPSQLSAPRVRRLWAAALVVLLLGTLLYPLRATPARLDDRFLELPRTVNGAAFMEQATYQDANGPVELRQDLYAIQWLRDNVEGSPAIMEANTPLYTWGSRFSIYTGLPTVIGWDFHQVVQRGKFASQIEARKADVSQFYSNPNPAEALRILKKYQVSYVIVGQLERLYYPAAGLAKFDDNLGGALELVYENPGNKIYSIKTQEPQP